MTADEESLSRRADRWLGLVAIFVAPTTVISGLCYFLGFVSTRHRLMWFGIDPGAVGFTTTDYAVKTVADYFVRVFEFLLICVVLLACALVVRRLASAGRKTRLLRAVAAENERRWTEPEFNLPAHAVTGGYALALRRRSRGLTPRATRTPSRTAGAPTARVA